jgi:hypothetical protein
MSALLNQFVERLLMAGLAVSAVLLAAGLIGGRVDWMYGGILLLMVTPGLRVILLTIGLAAMRDYVFAALSLGALLVLVASAATAYLR